MKVVPEGYNGAGLGAWALFGNRCSSVLGGAGGGMLGDDSTNINVLGATAGSGSGALIEKNNTDHFNLYKYTRDADDDIRKEISELKAELAVTKAIRPYQDKLIQCEMERMFTAGINYTNQKTCNVIYGVVTLPNEPTVTGLVGRNANGCLPCGFTQPASGTPAQ